MASTARCFGPPKGSGRPRRYESAGDYQVTLTLATFDGRVSQDSKTLRIHLASR